MSGPAAIAWFAYTVYRSQQLTLSTISDGRRAILFGSIGMIALLIAGYDQFRDWGSGAILGWILLLAAAIVAIFVVWRDATRVSTELGEGDAALTNPRRRGAAGARRGRHYPRAGDPNLVCGD